MLVLDTNVIRCGGRFGSFAFAEVLALCDWAKANPPAGRAGVPNVRLAKILFRDLIF